MRKNRFSRILTAHLLAILAIMIILSSISLSSEPLVYIENELPLSECIGEETIISGFIKNINDEYQSYKLNVTNEHLDVEILSKEIFNLQPGKAEKFEILLTQESNLPIANTYIELAIESNNNAYSKEIPIQMKNCRNVELDVPDEIEICRGDNLNYNIYAKNQGEYKEEILILLDSNLNEINEEFKFNLSKNKIKVIPISSKINIAGELRVSYKLKIEDLKDYTLEKETKILVKKCADAQINYIQNQKQCIGQKSIVKLEIENKGTQKDEFIIHLGDEEKSRVWIDPFKKEKIDVSIDKDTAYKRNFPIELTITSQNGFSKNIPIILEYINCNSIETYIKNNIINVCRGSKDELPLKIELQNGPIEDIYSLKSYSDWLKLYNDTTSVILKPYEDKEINATIKVPSKKGQYNDVFSIQTKDISSYEFVTLNVLDCFDFEADLNVQREICRNSELNYELTIYNFGETNDEYLIEMIYPTSQELGLIEIEKTDELTIPFDLFVNSSKSSEKISLKITSKSKPEMTKVLEKSFQVLNCYDYQLEYPENFSVCAYEKGTIPITIKNTGENKDSYLIRFICPSYIDAQNQTFELDSQNKKEINLKYNIPKEFDKTSYCAILVDSNKSVSQKTYSTVISLLDEDKCYCTKSEISELTLDFKERQRRIELILNNCGRIKDNYELKVYGEFKNYVTFTPQALNIQPSRSGTFYITFLKPNQNITNENNNIKLSVQSKATDFYKEYEITLVD